MNIRTFANVFEFYKSTLPVTLAVAILPLLFAGLQLFLLVFFTMGFFVSILNNEIRHKNDYLFYYNNGISKFQLITYSFFLNIAMGLCFGIIFIYVSKYVV